VFYVYNRVESIHHVAEKLRKLVPMARIGVGHGQMTEKELEPIMVGFIKGEIDVLLSTTIIENGIDISNANTLIVEQADRLGLSQLYQLRGRVGRSDRQAYAYFLYSGSFDSTLALPTVAEANQGATGGKKRYSVVSDGAMARLQALQEFSTLGSGYSLAFRDLQIRGAGELLGAKQSGTMVNVGYELYTQLIQEAVAQLKNTVDGEAQSDQDVRDPLESLQPLPAFEMPVKALIPDGYIKDQAQRLYYYQKMMSSRDEATLGAVQAEVEDRYGHLTAEVQAAFRVMGQRMQAGRIGIDKLDARQGRLSISFKDRGAVAPRVFSILGRRKRDCYVTKDSFIWPYSGPPMEAVDHMLHEFEAAMEEVEASRARLEALS
jgi:transcription-repair coupling factor (superfamily II helicase)